MYQLPRHTEILYEIQCSKHCQNQALSEDRATFGPRSDGCLRCDGSMMDYRLVLIFTMKDDSISHIIWNISIWYSKEKHVLAIKKIDAIHWAILIKSRFRLFKASWRSVIKRRNGRENAFKRRHDSNWKGGGKWRPFRWRRGWWLVETRLVARVIPAMQLRSTFKET